METSEDRTFYPFYVAEQVPARVEPGGFASFTLKINPAATSAFTRLLLDGTLRYLIVIDQDGELIPFAVPEVPEETPTRRSNYGRVSKH